MRTTDRGRSLVRGRVLSATGRATSAIVGATGRSLDPGNPLYYAQQYDLLLWLRADMGITLGATLRAAGPAPPAVTISGSTTQQVGLYLQCDGAGVRGAATFKWSVDNGATFEATGVLTAASVALGSTGIVAEFPLGAYLTDNIWQGTVSAWADQSGLAHHVAQGTAASQPLFIASDANFNSYPVTRWADHALENTVDNLVAVGAGKTLFVVFRTAVVTGGTLFDFHRLSPVWCFQAGAASGGGNNIFTDGVSVNLNITSFPDVNTTTAFVLRGTPSSALDARTNGTARTVNGGNLPAETRDAGEDGFTVGNRKDTTTQGLPGEIAEVIVFSSILPLAVVQALENGLISKYAA